LIGIAETVELRRSLDRQRLQHHAVDQREDRRIAANPERQRQDADERKPW
jgi:hypothetical protein